MKRLLILTFFILVWGWVFSQKLIKTDSLTVQGVTVIEIDPSLNLYVGTQQGDVFQYNAGLEKMNEWTHPFRAAVTSISAIYPFRIQTALFSVKENITLDRYLRLLSTSEIPENMDFILHTKGPYLWLIDEDDFLINQYDPINKEVLMKIDCSVLSGKIIYANTTTDYLVVVDDSGKLLVVGNNKEPQIENLSDDERLVGVDRYANLLIFNKGNKVELRDILSGDFIFYTVEESPEQVMKYGPHYYFFMGDKIIHLIEEKN